MLGTSTLTLAGAMNLVSRETFATLLLTISFSELILLLFVTSFITEKIYNLFMESVKLLKSFKNILINWGRFLGLTLPPIILVNEVLSQLGSSALLYHRPPDVMSLGRALLPLHLLPGIKLNIDGFNE